jgi:hypothetical protein
MAQNDTDMLAQEQRVGNNSKTPDLSPLLVEVRRGRLLMVLAGSLIKEPSLTLRVVTGLPVQVWDKQTTVPQVVRSLCGSHQFVLNGQARVMTVEAVLVVMEGAGALAVHGLAEDVPQAVIDIGSRTTELFWAQGQRPILPRCAGFERGVGDVGDVLAAWFLEQYGRELAARELRDALWSYAQHKPHRPIFVDSRPVQINDTVARCVRGRQRHPQSHQPCVALL